MFKYKISIICLDLKPSDHWTINDRLANLGQLLLNDGDGVGQPIKGNLGEHMVFSLVLHSAHQDEPEEVSLFVVSAGNDLVINEVVLDLFVVPELPFVVSD